MPRLGNCGQVVLHTHYTLTHCSCPDCAPTLCSHRAALPAAASGAGQVPVHAVLIGADFSLCRAQPMCYATNFCLVARGTEGAPAVTRALSLQCTTLHTMAEPELCSHSGVALTRTHAHTCVTCTHSYTRTHTHTRSLRTHARTHYHITYAHARTHTRTHARTHSAHTFIHMELAHTHFVTVHGTAQ